MNIKPIGIDLCSGVGGMSLGFEQAGFEIAAAIEIDRIHSSTYAENFPKRSVITADLAEITGNEIREQAKLDGKDIDVVFGGPPCGGFSMIGKRRFEDARNELLLHFGRLVDEIRPKYFVVENVKGLLVQPMDKLVNKFTERVERAGYNIVLPIQILNASDYGVPQHRQRVFILGYREDMSPPTYPISPNKTKDSSVPRPSVWDAIGDLPNIDEIGELTDSDIYTGELLPTDSKYAKILRGDILDEADLSPARFQNGNGLSGCQRTKHKDDSIRRFAATMPGTIETISRFYRLSKNGQSPTLRAGTGKDYGSYSAPRPIHPVMPRCITVREGARLHSFPDWFKFHKTKWHGFRQIGNAVPPMFARAVAKSIIKVLDE